MDEYLKKYVSQLHAAKDDAEMLDILDKIYTDGFIDGKEDLENEQDREDVRQGRVNV